MAAPSIRIPPQYELGLRKIRELSSESVRELLASLEEAPLTLDDTSLSETVASKVGTVSDSDVVEIVPALLFFYSFRDVTNSSASEAAQSIADAMEESGFVGSAPDKKDRTAFVEHMMTLLSLDSLMATARAGRVLTEHERVFRQARIFTDIRPVFEQDEPEHSPTGTVITHTLKLGYYADNEYRDFYVVLDTGDVDDLIDQLRRANEKADSIKRMLNTGLKIPYIDAG